MEPASRWVPDLFKLPYLTPGVRDHPLPTYPTRCLPKNHVFTSKKSRSAYLPTHLPERRWSRTPGVRYRSLKRSGTLGRLHNTSPTEYSVFTKYSRTWGQSIQYSSAFRVNIWPTEYSVFISSEPPNSSIQYSTSIQAASRPSIQYSPSIQAASRPSIQYSVLCSTQRISSASTPVILNHSFRSYSAHSSRC